MADNTNIKNAAGGTETIADDEITDGGVASGAKAQRLKVGFGDDGQYTDTSASNPLPVTVGDLGTNINPLSVTPAGGVFSVVGSDPPSTSGALVAAGDTTVFYLAGSAALNITVTGTWTGTLVFESGTGPSGAATWQPLTVRNLATGADVTSTTANGEFFVDSTRIQLARVRVSAISSGQADIVGQPRTVAAPPAVQPVSDNGGSLTVDGTVGVSGTVTVDGSGHTQPVSGTVNVGNLPATQNVSITGTNAVDTELPAATALSDTTASPTTPVVGAAGLLYDSSTSSWARARNVRSTDAAAVGNAGLPAAGLVATDGANYRHARSDSAGNLATGGANVEYAGTITNAGGVSGTAGTGIDARGYTRWILQLSGTYTGTPTIQYSNDNTNWFVADRYFLPGSGLGGYTNFISSGANNIFSGPVVGRYLRISYNAFTSGTATYTLELSNTQSPYVYAQTVLPAPGALADATANPNTTQVAGFPHVWNGASWDRLRAATSAAGTTGAGIPAAGMMGWDGGTLYQRAKVDSAGSQYVAIVGAVDTELPAAGALSDGFANPTTPMVGGAGMVFNGASWDRQRAATSAAGTTGTGVQASGAMGFDGTNYQRLKSDTAGLLQVTIAPSAAAGSGWSAANLGAWTGALTVVKASAGLVGGYMFYNAGAAAVWVEIFNAASTGAVTLGTTTPAFSVPIPPGSAANMEITAGVVCSTGIVVACTTAYNGATIAAASGFVLNK